MMSIRMLGFATFAYVCGAGAAQAQNAVIFSKDAVDAPASGVALMPPPPADFDALSASPAARAAYAIPPAPDALAHPKQYAAWAKAVGGPSVYVTPKLTQTTISHGPSKPAGPLNVTEGVTTGTSGNWSGSVVLNFTNPKNLEAIVQLLTVPEAHQAFGTCKGYTYSAIWPGIDGDNSSDVLQAGIEANSYCANGLSSTLYYAWIEWYPYASTRVSSPAISPGDLVYVQVWNTSTTQGYAYLKNFSTNVAAEYSLTAPKGTVLKGNSVEWIAERPSISGSLATLTNYIYSMTNYGFAWDYTASPVTYVYPNQNPAVGTLVTLTMLDNSSKGISSATGLTYDSLLFYNFGSSCGLGNAAGSPC